MSTELQHKKQNNKPAVEDMPVEQLREEVASLREVAELIELRGVDTAADAKLENIWIAGIPVGTILENVDKRSKENEKNSTDDNLDIKKRINNIEDKLSAIGADGIKPNSPDKRALVVRKWLYEQANESKNGKASMNKNVAKGVLGNITREQRYEAMRRAAGGNQLARSGSSGLSPVQGIEFQKFDDPDRLTRVVIDLEDVTNKLGRQILTTDQDGKGA